MITEEERQSIINEAVEKTLLLLPEIVGNLIMSQVNILKINRKFYEDHKEFSSSKDIVASVVEKIEGENPGLDYKEILDKSIPFIKDRIKTMKSLDVTSVSTPDRNLPLTQSDNGEL